MKVLVHGTEVEVTRDILLKQKIEGTASYWNRLLNEVTRWCQLTERQLAHIAEAAMQPLHDKMHNRKRTRKNLNKYVHTKQGSQPIICGHLRRIVAFLASFMPRPEAAVA